MGRGSTSSFLKNLRSDTSMGYSTSLATSPGIFVGGSGQYVPSSIAKIYAGPGVTVMNEAASKELALLQKQVFRKYKDKMRYSIAKRSKPSGRKYVGKYSNFGKKVKKPKVLKKKYIKKRKVYKKKRFYKKK